MKDFSNVRGTLRGWTERSCEWYETASDYTGYHDRLLEALLPFLRETDRCCEIACGTGLLARKTAPHIASYTANDADPTAMSFLRRQLTGTDRERIRIQEGDWREALKDQSFDVVLTSYFGVPVEFWPLLRSLARRMIIIICPRNERWRKIRQREEFPDSSPEEIRKLETPGHIKTFYELQGIPYQAIPLDLEFGQPLADRKEVRQYIEYYYHLQGTDADEFIDAKCCRRGDLLYFPKKKEIEVIAADVSGVR